MCPSGRTSSSTEPRAAAGRSRPGGGQVAAPVADGQLGDGAEAEPPAGPAPQRERHQPGSDPGAEEPDHRVRGGRDGERAVGEVPHGAADRAFTVATSTTPVIRFLRTRVAPRLMPLALR